MCFPARINITKVLAERIKSHPPFVFLVQFAFNYNLPTFFFVHDDVKKNWCSYQMIMQAEYVNIDRFSRDWFSYQFSLLILWRFFFCVKNMMLKIEQKVFNNIIRISFLINRKQHFFVWLILILSSSVHSFIHKMYNVIILQIYAHIEHKKTNHTFK